MLTGRTKPQITANVRHEFVAIYITRSFTLQAPMCVQTLYFDICCTQHVSSHRRHSWCVPRRWFISGTTRSNVVWNVELWMSCSTMELTASVLPPGTISTFSSFAASVIQSFKILRQEVLCLALCTDFFCLGSVSAPIGRWQPVGGTKNTNIYVRSWSVLYSYVTRPSHLTVLGIHWKRTCISVRPGSASPRAPLWRFIVNRAFLKCLFIIIIIIIILIFITINEYMTGLEMLRACNAQRGNTVIGCSGIGGRLQLTSTCNTASNGSMTVTHYPMTHWNDAILPIVQDP